MIFPTDIDAYFRRIRYAGPRQPTLAALNEIVAAHVRAIPFENLDVLLGRPIDLAGSAIFSKLVHSRRGGYCFEHNGLLLDVLVTLGFRATPIGARVRYQRPRDYIPPRTHMFVRVVLGGDDWLADVGVGGLSPTSALRLDSQDEQKTLHEPRRILREGGRLYHQIRFGDEWEDVCEFTMDDMPPIDRELANWYTSAHPQSHFKNRLIVARAETDGARLTLLNNEFKVRRRDGRTEVRAIATADALLDVLAEKFALNFSPGTRFGSGDAPWPT